jgi:hypothetical protein
MWRSSLLSTAMDVYVPTLLAVSMAVLTQEPVLSEV